MLRFALASVLAGSMTACATDRCPEPTPPPPRAEPTPPPREPITACTLARADAEHRAAAWLAQSIGAAALPPELAARSCETLCHTPRLPAHKNQPIEPCASWQCTFRYGKVDTFGSYATLEVFVAGCGANIFTATPYHRCYAQPHGCKFAVDRPRAIALTIERGHAADDIESEPRLTWSPEHAQFIWIVGVYPPSREMLEVHINAHTGELMPAPSEVPAETTSARDPPPPLREPEVRGTRPRKLQVRW